jgi:threonine/homoserine/homoserine lactone efflux protein
MLNSIYLGFIAAVAVLLILPGPTNALLMTAGAERGVRRAIMLVGVEIIAYGLAITPLLIFSELLGTWRAIGSLTLKSIAIALILLLAYRMWRRAGKSLDGDRLVSAKSVFWITLFNPKSLIFAFAIFPPVMGIEDILAKAIFFTLLAFVAGAAWIAAGNLIVSGGLRRIELIGRASAIVLCAFAIYLGTSIMADAAHIFR